jgi:hypothetical protein
MISRINLPLLNTKERGEAPSLQRFKAHLRTTLNLLKVTNFQQLVSMELHKEVIQPNKAIIIHLLKRRDQPPNGNFLHSSKNESIILPKLMKLVQQEKDSQ